MAQQTQVREQLSGACTTEIAAFDDFVGLLAGDAEARRGERGLLAGDVARGLRSWVNA